MKSLRTAIASSWLPEMKIVRRDLATTLQLSDPLSITELVQLFDQPEVLTFRVPLDADALHGEVRLVIRSDGSYIFSGFMRATGALSFAYKVQASLRSGGTMLAIETNGRVFGSDTPGERQRDWNEASTSKYIRESWTAIRTSAQLDVHLDKNVAGVLGALVDVGRTVVETYVAVQLVGNVGAVIVLGSELGAATGQTFYNPNILAGAIVAGGTIAVLGPGAIIPAVAAGVATVALADISFRPMNAGEVALAKQVFKDKLPIERIVVTDLYNPGPNGIAREFVIPGLDGSILVNMGKNYDSTLQPDVQGRQQYSRPGQVLIHELTHAWQVQYASFMPGFICRGMFGDKNYDPDLAEVNTNASFSTFGLEEQATIIDSWYGAFSATGKAPGPGLENPKALQDPKFFYVSNNIRLGRT